MRAGRGRGAGRGLQSRRRGSGESAGLSVAVGSAGMAPGAWLRRVTSAGSGRTVGLSPGPAPATRAWVGSVARCACLLISNTGPVP